MIRLRKYNINTPEYFNRVWSEEDYPFDRVRLEAFLKWFNGGSILDLGAGVFGLCHWISLNREYAETLVNSRDILLSCLDFSKEAKRRVLDECKDIDYFLGNVLSTPFKAASFTLVTAGELIEHIEKPERLVTEMRRLVSPSGSVAISTVDPDCEDSVDAGLKYPEHLWKFSEEDLVRLFESKFKFVKYGKVGNYHFIWAKP